MSTEDLLAKARNQGEAEVTVTINAKELAARAKYEAGAEACIILVNEYITAEILDLVEDGSLEESKLVSTELARQPQGRGIQAKVNKLSSQIKYVISEIAREIEEQGYENWEEALEGFKDAPKLQQNRIRTLVDAEKEINVSLQSLRTTVQVFSHLNKHVIDELQKVQNSGNKREERRLVLVNAILVYELANFAIQYLDQFNIQGLDKVDEIERQITEKAREINSDLQKFEVSINNPDFPDSMKPAAQQELQSKREVLKMMLEEWQSYKSQISSAQADSDKVRKTTRAILDFKLNQAKTNLHIFEAAWWINRGRETLTDLEGLATDVGDLEVAALTTDRVRRLFLDPGT